MRKAKVSQGKAVSTQASRRISLPVPNIARFASEQSYSNLTAVELFEHALVRKEGRVSNNGALVVLTGLHTGRAATDKFVVRDAASEKQIWWENNKPMTPAHFDALYAAMFEYAKTRELFIKDAFGGTDPTHHLPVRIITELAWHSLFAHQLLIRPDAAQMKHFKPAYTIIVLPGFKAKPAVHGTASETVIAVNFTKKIVLIGGTAYAGEIKKSVFTILNYLLPPRRVMPMHCSANVGNDGSSAIFFGLSGTGKTTLSADASRTLVGDDEHGWSEHGVFNFEGGCYAKVIRLSQEAEPEIYATTQRFGTVLEKGRNGPNDARAQSRRCTPCRKHSRRLSAHRRFMAGACRRNGKIEEITLSQSAVSIPIHDRTIRLSRRF
jgi:phosphoenolpyruvate carboxykinase (ATP)